jgi:metalloendopeptidase OMA1, mitochondrial
MLRPVPRPPPISNNSPILPDSSDSLASSSNGEDDRGRLVDTCSLSASVTDYPVHWGRRYHSYREGSYMFPNDDTECERLDAQHHIFLTLLDGRYFLAPLDPETCLQVLDVGTGTGIWCIELADHGPLYRAQITGVDLSPTQPTLVPENVMFEIQDCSDKEWTRPLGEIDFIFARMMAGSFTSYRDLIKNCRKYLRPGSGYLELHEIDPQPFCDDGSMPEDWKLAEWESKISEASEEKLVPPRPMRVAQDLEQWMLDCGYEDVSTMLYKIPLGPWPKDRRLKDVGIRFVQNLIDGLPGFSYKLLGPEGLGWNRDEIEMMLLEVRRSLAMRDVHAYMRYYIVFGRRPTQREESRLVERRMRGENG